MLALRQQTRAIGPSHSGATLRLISPAAVAPNVAAMSEAKPSRYLEELALTVVQVSGRGGVFRIHCLACDRRREIEARSLPGRYADRTVGSLTFSCTPCRRARRKYSIHPPGFDAWHEIVWPGEDSPAA